MNKGYWKGKKLSEDTRKKMSLVKQGKIPKNIEMFKKARKEYKVTEADRLKMSQAQKRIGSKPPSRRGTIPWNYEGKTLLQEQIRKCFEYLQWRSEVYKRDKYTCQHCGDCGVEINADHIKEFAKILKEYNIKTLKDALLCKELWDIDNGRTLCVPCHKSRKQWDNK